MVMELKYQRRRRRIFSWLMRILSRQRVFELNLERLENFINTEIAMKPSLR